MYPIFRQLAFFASTLALFSVGCSSNSSETEPSAKPETEKRTGKAALALALTDEDNNQYRFIGSLNVLTEGESVVTLVTNASSSSTHTLPLLPGSYTVSVNPGYECTYSGELAGYTGCTFTGAEPDPFQVVANQTTPVALAFTFHFEEHQDVHLVFQLGKAQFNITPQDEALVSCGGGAACAEGQYCASLENETVAHCYTVCNTESDCSETESCILVSDTNNPQNHYSLCAPLPGCTEPGECGSSSDDDSDDDSSSDDDSDDDSNEVECSISASSVTITGTNWALSTSGIAPAECPTSGLALHNVTLVNNTDRPVRAERYGTSCSVSTTASAPAQGTSGAVSSGGGNKRWLISYQNANSTWVPLAWAVNTTNTAGNHATVTVSEHCDVPGGDDDSSDDDSTGAGGGAGEGGAGGSGGSEDPGAGGSGGGEPDEEVSTEPNLLIAFIGDQGNGSNANAVLNLIKNEGAVATVHNGDFDYGNSPNNFENRINNILGVNYPYFAVIGNHDAQAWGGTNGYGARIADRVARVPEMECTGEMGVQANCYFRGLHLLQSCIGTQELRSSCGNNNASQVAFINNSLATDGHVWSVCSWHKNQQQMQVGTKTNEVGWGAYQACMNGRAIISTGHEHSYSRTLTLTGLGSGNHGMTGAHELVEVAEGRTFVFVSGLGGNSVRALAAARGNDPWWSSWYTNNSWKINGAVQSGQSGTYGALFIRFHVDGDPKLAHAYFKDLNGRIADNFSIRVQ